MSSQVFRWGVIAPGSIANKFAQSVRAWPDHEIVAVGSRALERAEQFGDRHQVKNRYGSYQELAKDPEVDAVYVATPHRFHKDAVQLCLQQRKPVLCEKPLTVNRAEADALVASAKKNNTFLMEAMWTRFLPVMRKVRQWVRDGRIGDIRMVRADFAFRTNWNPQGRLLNPELAGGSLLDVGVYVISLAFDFFRRSPVQIQSIGHIGRTGVDEHAGLVFGYDDGALAVLTCGVRTKLPVQAIISGTEGTIEIPPSFYDATKAILKTSDGEERIDYPHKQNGFEYEVAEVARCVREGKLESEIMPLDHSLAIADTMDSIRSEWGLAYPFEEGSR
jgi:predicted dehydrogenase